MYFLKLENIEYLDFQWIDKKYEMILKISMRQFFPVVSKICEANIVKAKQEESSAAKDHRPNHQSESSDLITGVLTEFTEQRKLI